MDISATRRGTVGSRDGTTISYETMGRGPGLLVLGGAWRAGRDYRRLAEALAASFTVHVLDRRGRGGSGPQGRDYSIEREVDDLLAVQAETGASAVFGHSYGGLITLEAARCSSVFSDVVVYEPGVSIVGSIPLGWLPAYREALAAGDRRGAFAAMVRGAGGAPPALERMPLWYVKLILRLFIRPERWRQLDPLLEAGLAEHEEVRRLDDDSAERYRTITARVVLLGGTKSRPNVSTRLFEQLTGVTPECTSEIIERLDHLAPDEAAPDRLAERVAHHLRRNRTTTPGQASGGRCRPS